MKQDVRVGVVGLGGRGIGIVRDVLLELGARVTAVCDLYEDRRNQTADIVEKAGQPRPYVTADYHEVLSRSDVEAVIVTAVASLVLSAAGLCPPALTYACGKLTVLLEFCLETVASI